MTQQNISNERQRSYGESWELTSRVFDILLPQAYRLGPYFHPWYMILVKLIRTLWSPGHVDNWIDMVGYAQLVIDDMKRKGLTAPAGLDWPRSTKYVSDQEKPDAVSSE